MRSKANKVSCALIVCTEQGLLENQSRLLVRSIRKWIKNYDELNIYNYSPRQQNQFKRSTKKDFEKANVNFCNEPLNSAYKEYPFANKIVACSHAERYLTEDYCLFLDSDQIFFNSFNEFRKFGDCDIYLRPVEKKGIAFESSKDPNYQYWKNLYKLFELKNNLCVETTIDNKRINGYWNAGFILVKREKGIFQEWFELFDYLFQNQLFPNLDKTFMDQIALALLIQKNALMYSNLDSRFNYPYTRNNLVYEKNKHSELDKLVSLHYHKLFSMPINSSDFFIGFIKNSSKYSWLINELKQIGMYPQSLLFRLKHYYYSK